jgi:phage terminase small subunit
MAGVKGRSGSGGARPGAGRPRKAVPPPTEASVPPPAGTTDPLAYLLQVMNDPAQDPRLRVRAAVAAAQYTHTKRGDGGKKEEQGEKAEKANTGKFAAAASPRLVVDNTRPN